MDNEPTSSRPFIALTAEPRDQQLVVVDLGYSAKGKTCGLYCRGADRAVELTFGDAVHQTAEEIRQLTKPLLILEAVLSTYHGPSGNPDIRGDFEMGRGWYCNAGVLTFAAALRFLHILNEELRGKELFLAEAFLSNKDKRTRHADDAKSIHDQFWMTETAVLRPGVEPASPLVRGVPSVRVFRVR